MARFEIRPKGEEIALYVKVDRFDLLTAIQKTCKDYNVLDQCLEDYFNDRTQFILNGLEVIPSHERHEFSDEFIEMFFVIDHSPENIREVKVYNDLLFEISQKQENIVFCMLNEKRRSFRMNEARREIVIRY